MTQQMVDEIGSRLWKSRLGELVQRQLPEFWRVDLVYFKARLDEVVVAVVVNLYGPQEILFSFKEIFDSPGPDDFKVMIRERILWFKLFGARPCP